MSDEINVISRTQMIVVEPVSGSVAVLNEGPMGPSGPAGPPGPKGDPGVGGTVVPWGIIAAIRYTTQSAAITTTDTDVMTLSWTSVAGRQYRVSIKLPVSSTVAGDEIFVKMTDGANSQIAHVRSVVPSPAVGYTLNVWALLPTYGGPRTTKARISRIAGTGNVSMLAGGTSPGEIVVEDLGPIPAGAETLEEIPENLSKRRKK